MIFSTTETHLLECCQTSLRRCTGISVFPLVMDIHGIALLVPACSWVSLCFSNLIEKGKGLLSDKLSFITFLLYLYLCQLFLSMSLKWIPLLSNLLLEERMHVLVCLLWCSSRVNVTVIVRRAEASLKYHYVSEGKGYCLMLCHLLRMVSII